MALTRDFLKITRLCSLNEFAEISNGGSIKKFPFITSVRTAKHYDPKFKWLRGKKYIECVLPESEKGQRRRRELINNIGIYPRYWKPKPFTVMSVGEVIDPYRPVVGDGKVSKLGGAASLVTDTKGKVADITAMRKIKNYEAGFTPGIFVQEAQDIYVKAHTTLMNGSIEELSQYVTESANEQMREGLKNCTLRWKFIESLEPPKIVQSRTTEVVIPTNLFAQVTVRFHTKQSLAIYDRFGRLTYGSEILAKDVLEYVVFEKHINNENGVWRLHAKIIPEWREADEKPARTYRIDAGEEEVKDEYDEYFEGYPQLEAPEPTESAVAEASASSSK